MLFASVDPKIRISDNRTNEMKWNKFNFSMKILTWFSTFCHSMDRAKRLNAQTNTFGCCTFIVRHIFQHYWKRTIRLFFIILFRFLSVSQIFFCFFLQKILWTKTKKGNIKIKWGIAKAVQIHSEIKIISLQRNIL